MIKLCNTRNVTGVTYITKHIYLQKKTPPNINFVFSNSKQCKYVKRATLCIFSTIFTYLHIFIYMASLKPKVPMEFTGYGGSIFLWFFQKGKIFHPSGMALWGRQSVNLFTDIFYNGKDVPKPYLIVINCHKKDKDAIFEFMY